MYSRDQLNEALNRACDAVQDAVAWDGDSEDVADATNLLVNVGLHFLDNPGASVRDAIEEQYGDFGEHLLDRLKEAV